MALMSLMFNAYHNSDSPARRACHSGSEQAVFKMVSCENSTRGGRESVVTGFFQVI